MQTSNGISYEEFTRVPPRSKMGSSPHETVSWDGNAGKRWLHCAWEDRRSLLNDLFFSPPDSPFPYGGVAIPILARIYPWGKHVSTSGNTVAYEKAAIELEYRTVDIAYVSASTDTYITETILPHQDHQWIGTEDLYWDANGNDFAPDPGIIIPSFSILYECFNQSPTASLDAVFPSYPCVNSNSVALRTLNFAATPGTLLYHPPKIWRAVDPATLALRFRYRFRFDYRAYKWNYHYNPKAENSISGTSGNWGPIYYVSPTDGTSKQVLRYPDFNFAAILGA